MELGGRFQLVERVGVGGSASVYRAEDQVCGDQAAVKVLHATLTDEPVLVDRFMREAGLLEGFDHPAIPCWRATSAPDDELSWFAIDFVEGRNLAIRVRDGASVRDLVEWCLEACDALGYLHRQGVIHRDVKPDNILVGSGGFARLVDFGISLDEEARLTIAGDLMGTPGFMAPEQRIDPRDAGPTTDLYALGVTLFSAATNRSGLELTFPATREAALEALPEVLRPVVGKATAAEVPARYPDADALQWALAEVLEDLS
jgi:serine/threonine-protein kinase